MNHPRVCVLLFGAATMAFAPSPPAMPPPPEAATVTVEAGGRVVVKAGSVLEIGDPPPPPPPPAPPGAPPPTMTFHTAGYHQSPPTGSGSLRTRVLAADWSGSTDSPPLQSVANWACAWYAAYTASSECTNPWCGDAWAFTHATDWQVSTLSSQELWWSVQELPTPGRKGGTSQSFQFQPHASCSTANPVHGCPNSADFVSIEVMTKVTCA